MEGDLRISLLLCILVSQVVSANIVTGQVVISNAPPVAQGVQMSSSPIVFPEANIVEAYSSRPWYIRAKVDDANGIEDIDIVQFELYNETEQILTLPLVPDRGYFFGQFQQPLSPGEYTVTITAQDSKETSQMHDRLVVRTSKSPIVGNIIAIPEKMFIQLIQWMRSLFLS